jgi:uncharacterized protein DUF4953
MERETAVRRVAIARFGERNIRPGQPLALLQERFVPVYFMHRFAINAVSKTIGGMEYSNAVRGDGQQATRPIATAQQRQALRMLLDALKPSELAIPDTVLTLMVPNATNVTPQVELFGSRTRPAFDELGAARTLAQMIVDAVLQRDRAARLVAFSTRGPGDHLTLGDVIGALVNDTWRAPTAATPKLQALQRVAQRAVLDRLILLAADDQASPEVRARAELELSDLRPFARQRAASTTLDDAARAHWLAIANDMTQWLDKREVPKLTQALVAPPGDPF